MKRMLALCFSAALLFTACHSGPEAGAENKADSIEARKDTLVNRIDSVADAKIDSIRDRAKDLKQNFDSAADARKDSLKKK